jgi:sulfite reductase alpha subunit-like flavoprotein
LTPQKVETEKVNGRKIDKSVRPCELLPANIQAARICGDLWRIYPEAPLSNLGNISLLCDLYGYVDTERITHKALHTIPAIRALQYEKDKAEREAKNNNTEQETYADLRMRGVTFNGD